jgi:hypothetical protein
VVTVTEPLAPFDESLLAPVARECGLDPATLRNLVERHQRYVRDQEAVGGVDGLVYEWRQSLFEDPLAEQDATVYYLAVPERVWRDFGERMDLAAGELTALRAVHDRQFRDALGGPDPDSDSSSNSNSDADPDGEPLILSKPG